MTETKSLIDIDDFVTRQDTAHKVKATIDREESRYKKDVQQYLIECGYTSDISWTQDCEQITNIVLRPSTKDVPAHFSAAVMNGDIGEDEVEYVDVLPSDLTRTKDERRAMKSERDAVRKARQKQRESAANRHEFEEYLRLKAKYEVAP